MNGLAHHLGQQRLGLGHAVAHVHLRELRIGALPEADGDRGRAGLAARIDIEQPRYPMHLLFEHGRDAVFHGARGGARVVGVEDDRRWGHRRVLGHRNVLQGNEPCNHGQDCQHPREGGSAKKELRHV